MQAEIDKEVQNYKNKQDPWGDNTPGYEMMLQRQRDIHALSTMFDPDHPERAKGHQLLVLDNTGKHLRAAIGTGDIDGADNVIVNTPGMDTGVTEEIVDTYDEKKKQARKPSEFRPGSAVNNTDNIVTEAAETGESVAGVTWLGYDAPTGAETAEGTNSVVSDKAAKDAAKDLASFYDGIQETHHGDPHLVAAGHSYGSNATGHALKITRAPDSVAIMGSPGPASIDSSDLNVLPDQAYAAAAGDDNVSKASGVLGFGGDPTRDPESDFTSLSTDAHDGYAASSGHSEYMNQGKTTTHSLGQITRGDKPTYVTRNSIPTK